MKAQLLVIGNTVTLSLEPENSLEQLTCLEVNKMIKKGFNPTFNPHGQGIKIEAMADFRIEEAPLAAKED